MCLSSCQNQFAVPCSLSACGLVWASSGVWWRPRHLTVTPALLELYWDPPQRPHGRISQYKLKRDGRTIFTGDHRDQNYTDTGLHPRRR